MRLVALAAVPVAFLMGVGAGSAQGPENVLVIVNRQSAVSQKIGDYYMRRRGIPKSNLCRVFVAREEEISREDYVAQIEEPVAKFLRSHHLTDQILYLVTTLEMPLRVSGVGAAQYTTGAAVDSELAILYQKLKGAKLPLAGPLPNPIFGKLTTPFQHPAIPMYMVTRLAAYDYEDVARMIDHAIDAVDRGKVVIDLRAEDADGGNAWLRAAAAKIPKDRLVLEETGNVLYDQKDVIAYASWGSNDFDRHRRTLGFEWLPGAIMTEFVSTDARTFARPPANWTIGTWKEPSTWFAGSPQALAADEIQAGVTGASGHVAEPFLPYTPRPDAVIPAYLAGRNLAESFYLGIRSLSWQNVVLGDPLCRLRKAR